MRQFGPGISMKPGRMVVISTYQVSSSAWGKFFWKSALACSSNWSRHLFISSALLNVRQTRVAGLTCSEVRAWPSEWSLLTSISLDFSSSVHRDATIVTPWSSLQRFASFLFWHHSLLTWAACVKFSNLLLLLMFWTVFGGPAASLVLDACARCVWVQEIIAEVNCELVVGSSWVKSPLVCLVFSGWMSLLLARRVATPGRVYISLGTASFSN